MNASADWLSPFKKSMRGFLVTSDEGLRESVLSLWPEDRMQWTVFERGARALEFLFSDLPDMLLVDWELPDMAGENLVRLIKSENVYRQLPVLVCMRPEHIAEEPSWNAVEADDFLVLPLEPAIARSRLALAMNRAARALDANPLTRLPGNTSIIQRIQELLDRGEEFSLAYADLDNFKSFNDKYGFSRGDEALMMSARVIVNTIRGFTGARSFVGHIGGDDFVFIVPVELTDKACQAICENFDAIVPSFYDAEDRERGGIRSTDRQGNVRDFPLMAVSIAVVQNRDGRHKHYGEVSLIASELKKKAKESVTSNYVIDRRTHEPNGENA